jgi:membrane protease subunit HflK
VSNQSDRFRDLGQDARFALRGVGCVLWGALGVLVLGWLLSGASRIDAKEVGFIRRFGAVVRRDIESGFTFLLPWPVDRLDTVQAKLAHRAEAGFSAQTREMHMRIKLDAKPEEDLPYAITGDQNIIHVSLVAQYTISKPYSYLYEVEDPEAVLACAIDEAILTTLAKMPVDIVLTTGKEKLRDDALHDAQRILDQLQAGIAIQQLHLETPPTVPRETEAAFQAVIDEKVRKQTAVNKAEQEKRRVLGEAEGLQARVVGEARSYKQARIEQARSEANSFLATLAEYRKNERAVRLRMYLNTMADVLARVRIYVLPPGQVAPAPGRQTPPALRTPRE